MHSLIRLKYVYLFFVCQKRVKNIQKYDFFINAVAWTLVESVKGLDILIDSNLKLDLRINWITAKVHACPVVYGHLATLV